MASPRPNLPAEQPSALRVNLENERVWSLVFLVAVAATSWPLWSAHYLPIQDLPQHLAAIRVLHSYADPAFDFARYFELDLFRTQYLAYYMCAHWLSYLLDVELANRLLVAGCVVATPYALRSLLRALGRDGRLGLFALPLAYNAHLILGFVNFLLAIPLALYGLSLAVQQRRSYSKLRALGLGCVALITFYAHIVPFALLALGVGLIALQRELKACARELLALVPAGAAALLWAMRSAAGQATVSAASGSSPGVKPMYQPARAALADLPNWLTDILHGDADARLLRAFLVLLGLTFALGLFRKRATAPDDVALAHSEQAALLRSIAPRLALLPLVACVLYFVAPTSYAWIWPIAQRFPLLALLFFIPALSKPPRYFAEVLIALVLGVTALQTQLVTRAFQDFDSQEVRDFDRALEHIPDHQRVAGLIYARGSRYVKFSPFIHYVAYYQARKGGAVMFSFADFPQSPFYFREDNRPPRVWPRWEWTPERVKPADLRWYDYVLVRGRAAQLAAAPQRFARVYEGAAWSVWRKLP